ncbi:ubiquitin carboxyl-terminal hydrolase 9X-like isoform X3 [Dysidea avara]|uniref:ubiquitin carboxyl-terminal hydrolase 9X-like isoform X3 n=1 Tax=Dysidea avara TaxID=196820 RepID=UPI003319FCF9
MSDNNNNTEEDQYGNNNNTEEGQLCGNNNNTEESRFSNNNNNTELSDNQDRGSECQQHLSETKDENKEKQEQLQQQQVRRTQADEKGKIEPFQYPLIGNPPFPVGALDALDKKLNRLRWVVPVFARDDLEQLLHAAINLCREGVDNKSEPCQRFFSEGLSMSFSKIMLDNVVIKWKEEIQRCIFNCTKLLIEICAVKMDQDCFALHDLLNLVLNPLNKWNIHNCRYEPETCGKDIEVHKIFARPHNIQVPKGWLVDMINLFGEHGGFEKFRDRILKGSALNVSIIAAMIRPFGLCSDFLTPISLETYIIPVVDKVLDFLDNLIDDELKKETASEAKSDTYSSIMKSLRHLSRRIPGRENVDAFCLKMILRLLKISSFSGKMNALNEINKIIPNDHTQIHNYQHQIEKGHISADKLAAWIKEHSVLLLVLQDDNFHQPQYVEKLEKIFRFCIKEHSLSVEDLDAIWTCQKSWVGASKKQRDDLLLFIHHLAKDDKEGVMACKVLGLLWNLAHHDDCPMDAMDQALNAHLKILECTCSQDRESQRVQWLRRCVDELMNNTWVLPALKLMEEIFGLFPETPAHFSSQHQSSHFYYRNDIIGQFDQKVQLLTAVYHNLEQYLAQARIAVKEDHNIPAEDLCLDNRFNHVVQVQNRLDFMRFLLRDGRLWLGYSQALMVWQALIENPVYDSDKEVCFKWFARLVNDEPCVKGEIAKKVLTENVMKLNPSALSVYGFKCFGSYFYYVNQCELKIVPWQHGFLTESLDLIGLNHLWHVMLTADHAIANKAIEMLKDIFTNVSSKLQQEHVHHTFIHKCMEILRHTQANLHKYTPEKLSQEPQKVQDSFWAEATKLILCLTLLKEYADECDRVYAEERAFPPHGRSRWGRPFMLVIRCIMGHYQPPEDIDLFSHSNETVAALRRHILQKMKLSSSSRLELYINSELLHTADDKRLVVSVPLKNGSVVTAKVVPMGISGKMSLRKSSSDPSSSHLAVLPNREAENLLPSVIMSSNEEYMDLLLSLGKFALLHNNVQLIEATRNLLKLIPSDHRIVTKMMKYCRELANVKTTIGFQKLTQFFFGANAFQALYYLEVCHALLMPSVDFKEVESAEFQLNFIKSGGIHLLMSVFANNNIMRTNINIMRSCFLSTVKMCKLLLITIGYSTIAVVAKALKSSSPPTKSVHQSASVLQNGLHRIVPAIEYSYKNAALHISQHLMELATGPLPNLSVVESLQRIAWAAGIAGLAFFNQPEQIHQLFCQSVSVKSPEMDDINLVCESLEVLCYALALSPALLLNIQQSSLWNHFVTDLLLKVKEKNVRVVAADQLFNMVAYCTSDPIPLTSLLSLLVDSIETVAKEHPNTSGEFFRLLARLFNHAQAVRVHVSNTTKLLSNELQWIRKIREDVLSTGTVSVEGPLLEGHMNFAVELLTYHKSDHKYYIGSKPGGMQLIEKLVHEFLFPASKLFAESKTIDAFDYKEKSSITPICNGTDSRTAAFKLLTALCNGCVENLRTLYGLLHSLFYTGEDAPVVAWGYNLDIESRPKGGFVGLKNGGATGYMNVILQQLYMIPDIRKGVLSVEKAAECLEEYEKEATLTAKEKSKGVSGLRQSNERKDTNKKVLTQLQAIFGHLLLGCVKIHTPKGFWRDFRLWGCPVNVREPGDAFEFFNCLMDAVDEGLKAHKEKPVIARVLGGIFADQKICKGCQHRYSREEPFTALNVDVRCRNNLYESLDTFVKGYLLEGFNAYHCEKCNKKIDTLKRLCIKKLPQILVIKLKRFDYDWEKECVVKYNSYFEFPRELDMSPYTAAALAKLEGEVIPSNTDSPTEGQEKTDKEEVEKENNENDDDTRYRLCGVVVHSGDGNGGRYYSFASYRPPNSSTPHWYKFYNSGEVTECKLDSDEELKAQCFGGECKGEVIDHVMQRTQPQYQQQKRWWSAYLLFYERINKDTAEVVVGGQPVPCPIRKAVQKQNLEFLHHKAHFNLPYFQFIKQLLNVNTQCLHQCMEQNKKLTEECEEIALLCINLGSEFLFNFGLRVKKPLCGPANEWYDALHPYLNYSHTIRQWFAQNVLLKHPERIPQYLLECPSAEVRNMFSKLLLYLCQVSNGDGPYPVVGPGTKGGTKYLSQTILEILLSLLKKEVPKHISHLLQYFHVFLSYAMKGAREKRQLLQLGVPSSFIAFCLNEGTRNPVHSPNIDYTKLYAVVSILIRCFDLSVKQQSSVKGAKVKPNPIADVEVQVPLTDDIKQWMFERTRKLNRFSTYIKQVIGENSQAEGTAMLLKHCCWENYHISIIILSELMQQIATMQTFDLRPIFDLLQNLLFLDDSWQLARFNALLKGVPNTVDGIMDIIQQAKQHHQKRAYLCIKFLMNIFHTSQLAVQIVYEDARLKKAWKYALLWLNGELERKPHASTTSSPAQSNEVSKGCHLERSNSAKITLKRATEIFPIEEAVMSQIRS